MPGQPVVLDTFGGMVASARPEDLPEGASPRCNDVDFIVGRFTQRPGQQNVYSFADGAVTKLPTAAASVANGVSEAWTNPAGVEGDSSYASINLGSGNSVTVIPESIVSSGDGIPWINPSEAANSASVLTATITAWSSDGTNVTITATNTFTAGMLVIFSGLSSATFLNGLTVPVNATGLSGSQFEVSFPWTSTSLTSDSGTATQSGSLFASAANPTPPFTAAGGEYVAYTLPTSALGAETGATTFAGAKCGIAAASWIAGGTCGSANDGTPDTPFLAGVDCGWSGFTVPTLPAGAVITRIYPVAVMTDLETASGFFFILSAGVGVTEVWSEYVTSDGQYSAPSPADSLGSADSDITGAYLNLNFTARTGPWPGGVNISSVALAVYYTLSGSTPGPTSLQILEATDLGLAIPVSSTVSGVEVDFEAGLAYGPWSNLVAQLTLNGVPVGSPKAIGAGSWPTGVSFGGSSDLWGLTSLTGAQVNGSMGLGVNISGTLANGAQVNLNDLSVTLSYSTPPLADFLDAYQYDFALTTAITGLSASLKAYGSGTMSVQLLIGGLPAGAIHQFTLPGTVETFTFGGPLDLWDLGGFSDATVDNPNFGVRLTLTSGTTAHVKNVPLTAWIAPYNADMLGIVPANLNQTDQVTLVLDSEGVTWEEDVTNDPTVLALQSLIPTVPAGSYLKGIATSDDVAFMAYSDLTQGRSQPMQFNGSWADRITQVGPGQAPVFTPQQSTSNTFDIATITQPPVMSDIEHPGFISVWLQSAGPGSTSPGNTVTVYYSASYFSGSPQPGAEDKTLVSAFNAGYAVYVYLNGTPITGTYQVTSVGNALPPGVDHWRYYFTIQVGSSAYQNLNEPAGTYQMSVATMVTTAPVPNLAVGNKITISGNSDSSYNSTWTITESLDSGQMGITDTSVSGGVATYQYALNSGAPPTAGELVTVTNTTNANGALNVSNAVIQSSTAFGGSVDTSGTAVTYVSGNDFSSLTNGEAMTISGTGYVIATVNSSTSITLTATAGTQTGAIWNAGTTSTGSFTVSLATVTDFPSVPEAGQATTAGTIFAFDPGFLTLGTSTDPIYGDGTGGSFVFVSATSQLITPGVKQGSVFFITRNGAVTRPAPPVQFTVPENCGAILVTGILLGPPNVVARGITLTESGQNGVKGGSFYTYDTPVSYVVNGVSYQSDALIVSDNTSTSATFAFTDTVLLASDEIDIPGNDYFNLMEIGSPAWIFQYAGRMLYGLCQNQLQNLLNMTFDGGYLPAAVDILPLPPGWSINGSGNVGNYTVSGFSITANIVTVSAVNSLQPGYSVQITGLSTGTYLNGVTLIVVSATGTTFTAAFTHANVGFTSDSGTVLVTSASIGLIPSLDFGNAFRIVNYGATSWTQAAILFQSAYQDYLGVNILQPNTPYSIRVKARSTTADAQQLTIQLPTYSGGVFGATLYGSATFSFNQGGYVIQEAELVTGTGLPIVPSTLQIAVGVSELAPGAGLEIDRIEIYPTDNPVLTTTILTSYASKFESVDQNTGTLGVGTENPQPAVGAFELLEQLYIEKISSLQITQDSPNYEPNEWQVRQTSDRAGSVGPNAFDEGEEFCLSVSRNGLYYFDGGKPMPVSRELQSTGAGLNLWSQVNWAAGRTIWIRNDLENRRVYIGLPLITPNFWLPNAAASTPTSPNVILMCNYTGCPTGEELAASSEVHITMFGDLKALDMRRKWSLWQNASPVAEFVPRQDGLSAPLFLCSGTETTKIYQFLPGAAVNGQNTDDGGAINWSYTTYGFAKAKQGQQTPGLGALRKIWYYLAATMEGAGQVAAKLLSNSLGALARNTYTIPLPFTLSSPQQNDQERVLEIGGQRVFIEFSSIGTGGYAEVGPVMLDGEMDKVSPHRGVSS